MVEHALESKQHLAKATKIYLKTKNNLRIEISKNY